MTRVAIYARVSTNKQDTENQLVQLREYCARMGWEIIEEFVDTDSGSKGESGRERFRAMMQAASQRKFDTLLFWALDRFTREGVRKTLYYLARLDAAGVSYKSFTEPFFESCGIFKDAVIAIMATLAEQESVLRSERTKAGLAIAKAKGKRIGRQPVPVDVSRVRRLRSEGLSLRKISNQLGVSVGTIHKIIREPSQATESFSPNLSLSLSETT
jgi:DNA invertase Pin-like site-specific DNA recombinase